MSASTKILPKSVAIDWGNTRLKAGVFADTQLVHKETNLTPRQLGEWVKEQAPHHLIVSSVQEDAAPWTDAMTVPGKKIYLTNRLDLPITLDYETPHTLGVDRIAAACGAIQIFPGTHCLVIDAGTCITYDWIDDTHCFRGGAIAPGAAMRFQAMHTFTARLPLVEMTNQVALTGKSTITSMQSGVINGMLAEIQGIIDRYLTLYPHLKVVLCGGDAQLFENQLKPPIFAAPDLVLTGLNRILTHHVGL